MAVRFKPKTLAKTLAYVACRAPWEYGLFWDPDGTMPWKEFYWALQQDPALRFVRESHVRELSYLGIKLPFRLEGRLLMLENSEAAPAYDAAEPPDRLHFGCRRKHYSTVAEFGLQVPANRRYLPLATSRDLALQIAVRRDPEPVMIEVRAREAAAAGVEFRQAGSGLYLAGAVPLDHLLVPPLPADVLAGGVVRKKKEKVKKAAAEQPTPGSFFLDAERFGGLYMEKGETAEGKAKGSKKGARKGPDWKKEARRDRKKRTL